MKYIAFVFIGIFATVGLVEASARLAKGVDVARIGMGNQAIAVSKIIDGETTCYISRQGEFGSHAISCVK